MISNQQFIAALSTLGDQEYLGETNLKVGFKSPHFRTLQIAQKASECIPFLRDQNDLRNLDRVLERYALRVVNSLSRRWYFWIISFFYRVNPPQAIEGVRNLIASELNRRKILAEYEFASTPLGTFFKDLKKLPQPSIEPQVPISGKSPIRSFALAEFREGGVSETWRSCADDIERFHAENPRIPFLTIDRLTEKFSNGVLGWLFSTSYKGQDVVYKLDKAPANAGERDPYPCYPMGIGLSGTARSLKNCLSYAKTLDKIANSPHFPKFLGIIYVKEKEQFGLLFEKIEGENLRDWRDKMACGGIQRLVNYRGPRTLQETVQILRDYAEGLKAMDESGAPHGDLTPNNLMIRYPEKRGIIVDHEDSYRSIRGPISCRQAFGCILYQMFVPWRQFMLTFAPKKCYERDYELTKEQMREKGIPENIVNLIFDCWSDKSMLECGWDRILSDLNNCL